MKNIVSLLTLTALFALLSAFPALSQNEMSPEDMEKAWANAVTPGEQQEFMAQMAGEWTYTQSIYMEPGKDPQVSQGKSTNTMILGGRYLRENASGTSMGMPFQGESTLSCNNIDGKWYSSWIDNMGTGLMAGSGERNGNTIEIHSTYPSMTHEGLDKYRMVTEVVSKDKHIMTMYMQEEGGPERKWMEIVYTRK